MRDQLRELFFNSFSEFLARECENILNGTSERNLCARWAPLLENAAVISELVGYYADPEYNRKQEGLVKTILDENLHIVRVTCDLILHSRGQLPNLDNLIAIEMKRIEHPDKEKQKDRVRLRALTKSSYDDVWSADEETLPEHVCGYALGYFVELDLGARLFRVEEYQHGELVDRTSQCF